MCWLRVCCEDGVYARLGRMRDIVVQQSHEISASTMGESLAGGRGNCCTSHWAVGLAVDHCMASAIVVEAGSIEGRPVQMTPGEASFATQSQVQDCPHRPTLLCCCIQLASGIRCSLFSNLRRCFPCCFAPSSTTAISPKCKPARWTRPSLIRDLQKYMRSLCAHSTQLRRRSGMQRR